MLLYFQGLLFLGHVSLIHHQMKKIISWRYNGCSKNNKPIECNTKVCCVISGIIQQFNFNIKTSTAVI